MRRVAFVKCDPGVWGVKVIEAPVEKSERAP